MNLNNGNQYNPEYAQSLTSTFNQTSPFYWYNYIWDNKDVTQCLQDAIFELNNSNNNDYSFINDFQMIYADLLRQWFMNQN